MTAIPFTNAVVTIQRRPVRNPATGVTGAPVTVPELTNIPIYVADLADQLRKGGISADFDTEILFDGDAYAIWDGDMITGYNPLGRDRIPVMTVQHVNPTSPKGKNFKSALVKVQG